MWLLSLGGVYQGPLSSPALSTSYLECIRPVAALLPSVPPVWEALSAATTRPIHLPDGWAFIPSSKGSCLLEASSLQPCPPSGAARGGSQGVGNERPSPFPWAVAFCLAPLAAWLLSG